MRFSGGWSVEDDRSESVAGLFGAVPSGTGGLVSGDITALTGNAKYTGVALGKVAYRNDLLTGEFKADIEITARYASNSDIGTIDGLITGFEVNGQTPDWSISLGSVPLNSEGEFGDNELNADLKTIWNVGRESADLGGTFAGRLYKKEPADTGIPGIAVGSFNATFRNIGRMAGGFGAATPN